MLAEGLTGATPPPVYAAGRVCKEPSCDVRLSRYNSTEWCALHESPGSTGRAYESMSLPRGRRRNSSGRRRAQRRNAA